jgi:hypothetical protein
MRVQIVRNYFLETIILAYGNCNLANLLLRWQIKKKILCLRLKGWTLHPAIFGFKSSSDLTSCLLLSLCKLQTLATIHRRVPITFSLTPRVLLKLHSSGQNERSCVHSTHTNRTGKERGVKKKLAEQCDQGTWSSERRDVHISRNKK